MGATREQELYNFLEAVETELGLYHPDVSKVDMKLFQNEVISKIEDLKAEATAYQTMTIGSNVDAMVYCLIKDMTGVELWRKVFNKMTKPAKRQLIGELLNSCLGGTYSSSGRIFEDKKENDNEL